MFPTCCATTCNHGKWWVRVSDNWLVIASCVTNSAYCWNGTAWVVLGTALLSLSRRPLLLTDARWEECLHHKVNIRLESGYRLAERRRLYAYCLALELRHHGWDPSSNAGCWQNKISAWASSMASIYWNLINVFKGAKGVICFIPTQALEVWQMTPPLKFPASLHLSYGESIYKAPALETSGAECPRCAQVVDEEGKFFL